MKGIRYGDLELFFGGDRRTVCAHPKDTTELRYYPDIRKFSEWVGLRLVLFEEEGGVLTYVVAFPSFLRAQVMGLLSTPRLHATTNTLQMDETKWDFPPGWEFICFATREPIPGISYPRN